MPAMHTDCRSMSITLAADNATIGAQQPAAVVLYTVVLCSYMHMLAIS